MPASCRRWDEYQCALIIITRSPTVLPSGNIIKVSRFSRCGTGVPRYHCGNDLGVPKFWDRDPRTTERKYSQVTDVPFQRDYQHNRGHSAAWGVAEGPTHFDHTKDRPSTEAQCNPSRLSMQSMAPTLGTVGPHQEIIVKRHFARSGTSMGDHSHASFISSRVFINRNISTDKLANVDHFPLPTHKPHHVEIINSRSRWSP